MSFTYMQRARLPEAERKRLRAAHEAELARLRAVRDAAKTWDEYSAAHEQIQRLRGYAR